MALGLRARWKAAALTGPFAAGFVALFVGGGAAGRYFTLLYAGNGYETQDHRGFRVVAPKGEQARGLAGANLLDDFMTRLKAAFPSWKLERPRDMRLLILRSQEDFERFGQRRTGMRFERNSGYFDPEHGDVAVILGDSLDASIRHEATHALFEVRHLPRWLNEGLATYFENSTAQALGAGDPDSREGALRALRAKNPDLGLLFASGPDAFYGPDNQAYYDLSNRVVAYFMDGNDAGLRQKFVEYVAGAREVDAPGRVEKELLGMPAADFQVKLIETLQSKDVDHGR